jgi:ATP-binding cassette subfamily F protein 3
MRMLSGTEAPDAGSRREGHQVVMQYFAQDEANRLDPVKTVYETMEADSPVGMVPMIRNILGGFLFTGDDIYKRAGVLSGGERTRLAVARMLLRPANTLLLDEPTNHLDLDSKDVLLEALEDFGGTLIFVSHDRYFVDRLATKVIEVGHGAVEIYPGTYEEFHWSKAQRAAVAAASPAPPARPAAGNAKTPRKAKEPAGPPPPASSSYEEKKRSDAEARRRQRAAQERATRVADLEGRIASREERIKTLEAEMALASFYEDRARAETVIREHQTLMWEVGDLMNQWEALQAENGAN